MAKQLFPGRVVSKSYTIPAGVWNPMDWFRAGEQGAWYDPSDWSTLFQDPAGTTPVTAVGQPVSLMLDKRLGLALGTELAPVTTTTAGWSATNCTLAIVNGEIELTASIAGVTYADFSIPGVSMSKWYLLKALARNGQVAGITYVGIAVGTVPYSSTTAIALAPLQLCKMAGAATELIRIRFDASAVGQKAYFSSLSLRELPGNHASQPTAINRPVLQKDASGHYYLAFNGTNSWMSTATIDLTSTPKMTVVAGVKKLQDALVGVVIESSAIYTNPGALLLAAPVTAAANYGVGIAGSLYLMNGYASPSSAVISLALDISAAAKSDEIKPRVNGIIPSLTPLGAATAGSGTFGNYPIYIGSRGGSSLFFNGNLYSLIIRGAVSTANQLVVAERYSNRKTGAY